MMGIFIARSVTGRIGLSVLILSGVAVLPAAAQSTSTWNITGNGNWNTAANWSPSGVPVSNPVTVLAFAGSTSYTATDNTTGSSFQLQQMIFDNTSTGGVIIGFTGSKSIDVATAGTATLPSIVQNGSGPVLISAAINNTALVTVGGTGTGSVTFATVNASAGFTVDLGNSFSVTINQYTVTGGNRTNTNSNTAIPLNIGTIFLSNNANNGRQLTLTATGPIVITGVIADFNGVGTAGSIVKSNAGSLTLDAQSTYSGSTTLNNGTTILGISNALPITTTLNLGESSGANSGTLDLKGWNQQLAGLQVTGGNTGTANAIINSTTTLSTLTIANSTPYTFSGSIGTVGNAAIALSLSGSSTFTLAASSPYTGGTTISSGTLRVNNATGSGTGSGPVSINGGVLGGSGFITGPVILNGGTLLGGTGGSLAAGNTLTTGAVTLNSGAVLLAIVGDSIPGNAAADPQSSLLNLGSQTLTKGTSGPYTISLTNDGMLDLQQSYTDTIAIYGATSGGLSSSDFTLTATNFNIGPGSTITVGANALTVSFTPIPEPGLLAIALSILVSLQFVYRSRA